MSEDLAVLSRQLGDRYLIERELGRGGMGAVYLARDRRLDRPVALKVLPAEFAAQADLRERFLRETRMAAGFSHPNIVPVFAVEDEEGLLAFAMGFVEGESVASRVARDGPLSRRDAVRLLQDVGYALAYAHGRGVVHRDIKPDNIMIERATGRALVMDFGIARAIAPVADRPGLTRVGEVVGTPEYMSPEQAAGESVDGRADLYSLGLVAWFAMTGRTAMSGDSTQRILVRQLTEPIPPLAGLRPDLPKSLTDVVDRCCAKEADDRFPNAEAVVEALDEAQLGTPELPTAIRLLAPELTSVVTRGLAATGMLVFGVLQIAANGNGNVFALGVIVAATAWVGMFGSIREIQRLRGLGYTVDELQRLLGQTLAERDDERARRATDLAQVRKRRRRVILAALLLVWQGSVLAYMRAEAGGGSTLKLVSTVTTVTFFASLLGTAIAIAILLYSPFKRSLTERLFSLIWLGAPGRFVMKAVGGGTKHTGTSAPIRGTPPPAAVASPGRVSDHRITAAPTLETLARDVQTLSSRVDVLESRRSDSTAS